MGAQGADVLVTGAAGFVGSHLIPALEASGARVVCVRKPGLPPGPAGQEWVAADLRDAVATDELVREVQPARVIHLAALAFPPDAGRDPREALRINYGAVHHLACALARHAPGARLLYVGTGQVYGAAPLGAPAAREDQPLRPDSIYAATKAAAERRLALAVEQAGLDVVCARPFHHTGPGRPSDYVEGSFASQIARVERGEQPPRMGVGNLDLVRDVSDVRDVVSGYRLLLERGERGGVYNVCSGRGRALREILDHLLSRARVAIAVERDPALYQAAPPERQALVGDPARLRALGWAPRYALQETLDALLESYRAAA